MKDDTSSSLDVTRSKEEFNRQLSALTDAMTISHGRDFTVGTLVLAARFIVQAAAPGSAPIPAASTAN